MGSKTYSRGIVGVIVVSPKIASAAREDVAVKEMLKSSTGEVGARIQKGRRGKHLALHVHSAVIQGREYLQLRAV